MFSVLLVADITSTINIFSWRYSHVIREYILRKDSMGWSHATLVLCVFGFLKEFRPSESFLTPYLVSHYKNFTKDQVNQEIYPIGTYSTLSILVIVFLVTDLLRYKPVVVVEGLSGVVMYALLIYGSNISLMQGVQVLYGLFIASDVAYYTYMYACSNRDMYQQLTSYTRLAVQLGRLLSGVVSQITISFMLLDYHQLHFLSLAGLSLAVVAALLLPPVESSVYFHRVLRQKTLPAVHEENRCSLINTDIQDKSETVGSNESSSYVVQTVEEEKALSGVDQASNERDLRPMGGLAIIWNGFCESYSSMYVVRWSIWWALTHCGYLQITSYIQNLWQDTVQSSGTQQVLYNGATSAVYTVLGVLASWAVGHIRIDMVRYSQWLLAVCALTAGALTILSATTYTLWIQYIAYGGFKVLYQVMMPFANSEVAKPLSRDAHGLVFGFNTFVALLLQTVLTMIVTAKGGLQLPIRIQFLVYGAYFIFIGTGFGISAVATSVKNCSKPVPMLQSTRHDENIQC